jgi:membrane fusion protein, multidrug efflux system
VYRMARHDLADDAEAPPTWPNADETSAEPADRAPTPPPERSEAPEAPPIAPEQTERVDEPPQVAKQAPSPARRRWVRWGLLALLPLALIVGGYGYVVGGNVMSTDDAYVEADKVGISTDISGIVQEVDVTENQHVTAGQTLYRLDPRQFQIALDNAKANLEQTALTIDAMKRDYRRMLSDIDTQQAQVELDQATFERYAVLVKSDAVTRANYDQARFTLQADRSKVASLAQQAQVQLARLGGNPDIAVTAHPQYLQVKAQVDEARRQLDHTIVRAPFDGIVTSVPSIAPGKYLQASMTAFEAPNVTQFLSPVTDAGRAALDALITQQAQIIAYIDDYKLLMIATLAVVPLLVVSAKARGGGGGHASAEL